MLSHELRLAFSSALAPLLIVSWATGDQQPVQTPTVKPAEESRLSTAIFHAGLKKRGLTDLLELHLAEFPPGNPIEALLMTYEIKLAEFADPTLRPDLRRLALDEANRLLEQLLEESSDDPRRFEWRFALARSLIYDQAEPFFTSVLYRGGSETDRSHLLALTTRAVQAIRGLLDELAKEYDRVDGLSIEEFEKLEASGYVEELDRLGPRAEYLLLWVLFYDSLPRGANDPVRLSQLNEIIGWMEANPLVLTTPHQTSHVQVQALFLAGACHRLLNNHQAARAHLERALAVADGITDTVERERIDWAVTLSWLERIRNDRDDGRTDEALAALAKFRQVIASQHGDNFGLRVVAALLERSIYRARAAVAESADQTAEGEQYRTAAFRPLVLLAQQEPDHRDELYAIVYGLIDANADPASLDPFEQCTLMAGLLFDADQSPELAPSVWDRVIEVGDVFLAHVEPGAGSLVPEVKYNQAVAHYRSGRLAAAIEGFVDVAKEHPTFDGAPQAASFAVQLGFELFNDPSFGSHPQARRLYRESLELLTTQYGHTDAAGYWRFFYAQLLEELEKFDAAAEQYAQVGPTHEHYVKSVFLRAQCLALALQRVAAETSADEIELQRRTHEFFAAYRELVALVTTELGRGQTAAQRSTLEGLLGKARLAAAEVQVLPHVDQHAQALLAVADFENEYPSEKALAGRVWRVRLLAYEKLGRLDEATRAIPAYMAADPEDAGATLQSLYHDLANDVARLRALGKVSAAERKAELALLLAEQIRAWAATSQNLSTMPDQDALALQLAEANLNAGHPREALELFDMLLGSSGDSPPNQRPGPLSAIVGRAEALFQLGELNRALVEFNRLAISLPSDDPIRWRSLLRDLECRTALKEPPQGVIKVIHQQKNLFPDLGGPKFAPQFERLLRENERRADEDL